MTDSAHLARQREFYESGAHEHLRADERDLYSRKIAARTAAALRLRGGETVLEVGAGFGRFTFPLLEHCERIVALDLTRRSLDQLAATRDARGIEPARCRVVCADVDEFADSCGDRFDAIVGFFFLHHLKDFASSVESLAPLLAPGARLAFIEPNRLNPLFAVQLTTCKDMNWRDEKGLYSLTPARIESAMARAGLRDPSTERFGFFPPQIFNESDLARRIEHRCERAAPLRWLLPFHLVSAARA